MSLIPINRSPLEFLCYTKWTELRVIIACVAAIILVPKSSQAATWFTYGYKLWSIPNEGIYETNFDSYECQNQQYKSLDSLIKKNMNNIVVLRAINELIENKIVQFEIDSNSSKRQYSKL